MAYKDPKSAFGKGQGRQEVLCSAVWGLQQNG